MKKIRNRRQGNSAGPGPCVHCLAEVQHRNWDHVLPVSWYPDTTPANVEKWQVPSCVPCNRAHGRDEEWLLLTFAHCLDPNDPACSGIYQRAQRAIDPAAGRDPKDRHHRLKLRQRFIAQLRHFKVPPSQGLFPNFGTAEQDPGGYYAVLFEADRMRRFVRKIVRGVVFMEQELLIDDGYEFTVSFMENNAAEFFIKMAQDTGGVIHHDPGISVLRAYLPEDRRCGIFAIEIWKRCRAYAVVAPKDLDERAKVAFLEKHGPGGIEMIERSRPR
jgi:hypothetical protein